MTGNPYRRLNRRDGWARGWADYARGHGPRALNQPPRRDAGWRAAYREGWAAARAATSRAGS